MDRLLVVVQIIRNMPLALKEVFKLSVENIGRDVFVIGEDFIREMGKGGSGHVARFNALRSFKNKVTIPIRAILGKNKYKNRTIINPWMAAPPNRRRGNAKATLLRPEDLLYGLIKNKAGLNSKVSTFFSLSLY